MFPFRSEFNFVKADDLGASECPRWGEEPFSSGRVLQRCVLPQIPQSLVVARGAARRGSPKQPAAPPRQPPEPAGTAYRHTHTRTHVPLLATL